MRTSLLPLLLRPLGSPPVMDLSSAPEQLALLQPLVLLVPVAPLPTLRLHRPMTVAVAVLALVPPAVLPPRRVPLRLLLLHLLVLHLQDRLRQRA